MFCGSHGCFVGFVRRGSLCGFRQGISGWEGFCGVVEAIDGLFWEIVRGAGSGEGGEVIGGEVLHFGDFWGGGIPPGYLDAYHKAIDERVSSHSWN